MGLVGALSHTCCIPPPTSFLCRKWKDLRVGDLVRLHDDNIVPVSWRQPGPDLSAAWGGLHSCLSSSCPPCIAVSFLLPRPSTPRPMCSCWPARSPAACATWRQPTLMGEVPVITRNLGAWEPASPSPVAPQAHWDIQVIHPGSMCGAPASWQGAITLNQMKGPTFAPTFLGPYCVSGTGA